VKINLILKSASPRRKQLLTSLGLNFIVQPSEISEEVQHLETPIEYLERVTIAKLEFPVSENVYVSSDTIVVFKGKIFPKPEIEEKAIEFLEILNGNAHQVHSGIAIFSLGKIFFEYDTTEIQFKKWTRQEIKNYIKNQMPFDKAGAYGIQDFGTPVMKFSGSYSNVVGFPIRKFFKYHEIWKPFLI
jgi:septum formation protein